MNTLSELAEKVITASNAGDAAEISSLTDQISAKGKKQTFSDVWNYENKEPSTPAAPGAFESAWQFTKKGTER